MKLIIIEGTDNTGKNTIISQLLEHFNTATIIHCTRPKNNDPVAQDNIFKQYAQNILLDKYSCTEVIIMNRSHIGEYVYGTLYRGRDEKDVLDMINKIDNVLSSILHLDIYYIQLLCSSEKLLHNNEDNKSLSGGDIEKIRKERDKFSEIYNHSILNKKLIYVNDGDVFRSKTDIFNEVMQFINK